MHLPMCSTRAIATWIRRSRERRAATNAMLAAVDGQSRLDQWDRKRGTASRQLRAPELLEVVSVFAHHDEMLFSLN
jgi:hypothetical protein